MQVTVDVSIDYMLYIKYTTFIWCCFSSKLFSILYYILRHYLHELLEVNADLSVLIFNRKLILINYIQRLYFNYYQKFFEHHRVSVQSYLYLVNWKPFVNWWDRPLTVHFYSVLYKSKVLQIRSKFFCVDFCFLSITHLILKLWIKE